MTSSRLDEPVLRDIRITNEKRKMATTCIRQGHKMRRKRREKNRASSLPILDVIKISSRFKLYFGNKVFRALPISASFRYTIAESVDVRRSHKISFNPNLSFN